MPNEAAAKSKLELITSRDADAITVQCRGRLTSEFSGEFKQQVKALLAQAKRLVLDFSELAYMDSSGLGAVVGIYVSSKSCGCRLEMIHFSRQVRELLGLTHLLSAFESCGEHMIRMP